MKYMKYFFIIKIKSYNQSIIYNLENDNKTKQSKVKIDKKN